MNPSEWKMEPGDRLETVAYRLGVAPQALWMAPANEGLRAERSDPSDLQPGDVLRAPEKKLKREPATPGTVIRFRRKHSPAWLRIRMWIDDAPRARENCAVLVDGQLVRLSLSSEGSVDCPVPLTAGKATLMVFYGERTPDVEIDLTAPEDTVELQVGETVLRVHARMLYRRPGSAEAGTTSTATPPQQR